VQHAEAALRVAKRGAQLSDVLETKLDPERLQREEAI
jgi:hypothetical protein